MDVFLKSLTETQQFQLSVELRQQAAALREKAGRMDLWAEMLERQL